MLTLTIHVEGMSRNFEIKDFPCTLGRAPGNSIVLDDLSISANHAAIYLEGEVLRIVNLNSTNGIRVGEVKVPELSLVNNGSFCLGSVAVDYQVRGKTFEKTREIHWTKPVSSGAKLLKPDGGTNTALRVSNYRKPCILMFLFFMLVWVASFWIMGDETQDITEHALLGLASVAAILFMTGLVSLLAKIVTSEFKYWRLLTCAFMANTVIHINDVLMEIFAGNIRSGPIMLIFNMCFSVFVLAGTLYLVFRTFSDTASRRKLGISAATVALLIVGGVHVLRDHALRDGEFQSYKIFNYISYPIGSFDSQSDSLEALKKSMTESANKIEKHRESM